MRVFGLLILAAASICLTASGADYFVSPKGDDKAPSGDAMVGMFRIVSGGKTRMTEFMAFEQRETGPALIMRHFGPGLIAREDKDAPLVWTLEKLEPNRAVFLIEKDGTRLEFLRRAQTLTITLEKTSDGKTTRSPFAYTLAAPAP